MKRWLVVLACLLPASAFAQDMIDLHAAVVTSGPADVADWPVTVRLGALSLEPGAGWVLTPAPPGFPDSWEFRAFGNEAASCAQSSDGCLQYTVWPVAKVNGQWETCGVVQMWKGRPGTGGLGLPTWHDDMPGNWTYFCGDLSTYHPNPGDTMGFFVTAGNARRVGNVTSVRERSNVVTVTLPPNDTGSWTFAGVAPLPPPPVVVPPPVVTPPPVVVPPAPPPVVPPPVVVPPAPSSTGVDDALLSLLAELEAKIAALDQKEQDDTARILAAIPLATTPFVPAPPLPSISVGGSWITTYLLPLLGAAGAAYAGLKK